MHAMQNKQGTFPINQATCHDGNSKSSETSRPRIPEPSGHCKTSEREGRRTRTSNRNTWSTPGSHLTEPPNNDMVLTMQTFLANIGSFLKNNIKNRDSVTELIPTIPRDGYPVT
jgi:hypothetical protein